MSDDSTYDQTGESMPQSEQTQQSYAESQPEIKTTVTDGDPAKVNNEADSTRMMEDGIIGSDTAIVEIGIDANDGTSRLQEPLVMSIPTRPSLQRNSMQQVPPPTIDTLESNNNVAVDAEPTNSLSLQQLRRIVADVHKPEPREYDFEYSSLGPQAEEIDEWFVYQFWQWIRLNAAQRAFEWHWDNEHENANANGDGDGDESEPVLITWEDADNDTRARFVQAAIAGVESNDAALRSASIGKLLYLVLGRWADTAMTTAIADDECRSAASVPQLQAIKAGVQCVASLDGLPVIWEALMNSFKLHWLGDSIQPQPQPQQQQQQQGSPQESQDELMNLMTIMYISIQEALNDPEEMSSVRRKLLDLNPTLVDFMMTATMKLRWDEQVTMPHAQIFLLFWKSILLVFGGDDELKAVKKAMSEKVDDDGLGKDMITASPLDYHVFRQEITSKYPAYIPPQPAIPLEAENTSLLPPLPNHMTRTSAANGIYPQYQMTQDGGASIMHQPVHIATPAPSPPPSPSAGGKGGKKQNYQTNQNFPFMYPPLDATSNSAGGKGLSGTHSTMVNRKWEGSEIPISVIEAGELFSSRVRMTRATRQLWDEREKFLKYERGWEPEDDDDDIEPLDLDGLTVEELEIIKELRQVTKAEERGPRPPPPVDTEPDFGPKPERLTDEDKRRLLAVEEFYRNALPHLQSVVIVLLRPILANVTTIVTQQQQQSPQQASQMSGRGGNGGPNGGPNGGLNPHMSQNFQPDPSELSPEEMDALRTREITAKAMTGILILLLKWFRVSHVLKFEYMTQLLLDCNYIPLVLKLFAHQDVQQVVECRADRIENSFFHFCNLRSRRKEGQASVDDGDEGEEEEEEEDMEDDEVEDISEDDAAPPPIKRRRPVSRISSDYGNDENMVNESELQLHPEASELDYNTNLEPEGPITDFSRRNFFSLINYLRIMQKVCKNKAHRNLLLIQYKSSTIIRKSLKVPQPELRLYTLKLFKGQVPYCSRKWRQSNMRVITAVYLHCRPELRDEWLAGSDVDADVDSALPLEQALRGLTHWQNLSKYPEKIAPEIRMIMREEQSFFSRELEKLDVNWGDMGGGDESMSEMDHVEW